MRRSVGIHWTTRLVQLGCPLLASGKRLLEIRTRLADRERVSTPAGRSLRGAEHGRLTSSVASTDDYAEPGFGVVRGFEVEILISVSHGRQSLAMRHRAFWRVAM
jgi:hypothetical protein